MQYLVHVGYVLQLCALLARDVLWLRLLLIAAQSLLAFYALWFQLWPYVFWNLLFVAINTSWVVVLLRERRAVALPAALRQTYERHFAALSPPEFVRLWESGAAHDAQDALLAEQGQLPAALYFLTQGEAVVRRDGRAVARLYPGSFVGEMSLLTGEACTADVQALGRIEYRAWPAARLAQLRGRNPVLWSKVQSVLGHDLVEKIKRSAGAAPPVPEGAPPAAAPPPGPAPAA